MRKKRFLTICAALTGIGLVLAGAGAAMGGAVHGIRLDTGGLHVYAPKIDEANGENHYESKEEQIEAFDSISASVQYADLRIEPSESDSYMLSYCLYGNRRLSVKREGSRLVLEQEAYSPAGYSGVNVAWFLIGSSGEGDSRQPQEEYITLRVPKDAKLSDVELVAEEGNIICEHVQAERIQAGAQYGDISLSGIQAQEILTETETGRLQMEHVQAKSCKVENQYGDVVLDDIKLTEDIKVQTEEGNVRLQDTQARTFVLESDYGNIESRQSVFENLQMSVESGNCHIEESSFDNCDIHAEHGNVELELEKELDEYGYELSAEYGHIKIGDQKMGETYSSLDHNSKKMIRVNCESGTIWVH